jgi:hypothetical protein
MMPIDDWNRMAVQGLLADTARVLALTDLDAVRGDREIVMTRLPTLKRITCWQTQTKRDSRVPWIASWPVSAFSGELFSHVLNSNCRIPPHFASTRSGTLRNTRLKISCARSTDSSMACRVGTT